MRFADYGCRALLRLFPHDIRAAHGAEMRHTFLEVCAQASEQGALASIRACVAEMADLASAAIRLRAGAPLMSPAPAPQRADPPRGEQMFRSIAHDVRMAVRSLMASPAHTALAAGVLAAGIGVNAAVFSIADSILFRPVPFADAARFTGIWNKSLESGHAFPGFSPRLLNEWRRQTDLFDRVEGYSSHSFTIVGTETTEMISGATLTPGVLSMLGAVPLQGRLFIEGDGRGGTEKRVILSERLWRTHFGADPSLVGRTVRLNDADYDVVGILPASFYFPYEPQQLWTVFDPAQPPAGVSPRLDAIGRLAPGVAREAAADQIAARGLELAKAAGGNGKTGAMIGTYGRVDTKVRNSVLALVGAVGFLLLIVCANLANLSLSRALSRSRDFAVRSALGASRMRLMRESLAESLLLGMLGAAAGLLVARLMLALTLQVIPERMTFTSLNAIDLDPRVLLFTALAGLITAVLFGLPPAILASRRRMGNELSADSRSTAGSRRARAVRSSLIVAEVALSVVLLVGAALMTRSFVKLAAVDNGFDPRNLIALKVGLPSNGYADLHARYRFTQDFLERINGLPGVSGATVGGVPPDSSRITFGKMELDNRPGTTGELIIPFFAAWPGYFDTVGIRIVDGRAFTADEPPGTVIVNEGFAAEFWPGESAVGKRLRWERGQWSTIVGVAGEVRQTGIDEDVTRHEFYTPMRRPAAAVTSTPAPPQERNDPIADYRTFIVRADDPARLIPLLRAALRESDARIAIWEVNLVEHMLGEEIARPRLILLLMSVFAVMALVLSAAGIYGVLSMTVVQRLREIGVRIALGAAPGDIGRLILRNGLSLTALGLALGLAGSFYVLRFVRTLLYEVEPFDPFSVAAVVILLGGVAAIAAWRPARRAMKVDPVALLRSS